jgi:uncharacterized membrane protein
MSSKWRRRERRRLAQKGFPGQQRLSVTTQQIQGRFTSGPIPPPDQLEHYERVQSGLAERIVAMAEKQLVIAEGQTKHRQDLEKKVIGHNIILSYLGLASGFVLGAGGLGAATWLIYLGKQLGGGAAFVASLATLAGLFFYGKRQQSQELQRKRPS